MRDLVEVYAVREALEAGASKVAVERASVAQLDALGAHLDRMEQAMADGDWLAGAENDLAFHRSLVGLAGNGRMSATYEQMLTQTLLLLRTAGSASARLRTEMPAEIHRDLLAALVQRDSAAANERSTRTTGTPRSGSSEGSTENRFRSVRLDRRRVRRHLVS